MLNRLKKDIELLKLYDDTIQDQLNSGIIEQIKNQKEKLFEEQKVHYILSHGVIREDKSTTESKIVYDCSAHEKEDPTSINCCLEKD